MSNKRKLWVWWTKLWQDPPEDPQVLEIGATVMHTTFSEHAMVVIDTEQRHKWHAGMQTWYICRCKDMSIQAFLGHELKRIYE